MRKKIRANFPNNTWKDIIFQDEGAPSLLLVRWTGAHNIFIACSIYVIRFRIKFIHIQLKERENNNSKGNEFLIEKTSNIPRFFWFAFYTHI